MDPEIKMDTYRENIRKAEVGGQGNGRPERQVLWVEDKSEDAYTVSTFGPLNFLMYVSFH